MPINWKPVILLATKYWPAYWPKNDFKTHRIILVSSKHNVIGQWFWLVSILTSYKPNEYTQYPVPFYEQTLHAKLGFFKVTQMSHILWVRGKFFRTQKKLFGGHAIRYNPKTGAQEQITYDKTYEKYVRPFDVGSAQIIKDQDRWKIFNSGGLLIRGFSVSGNRIADNRTFREIDIESVRISENSALRNWNSSRNWNFQPNSGL